MSPKLLCLSLAAMLFGVGAFAQDESIENAKSDSIVVLDKAIFANDDAAIAAALTDVLNEVEQSPQDYDLRIAAARGYLARADLVRADRQMGDIESDEVGALRDRQAEWGEAGAAHASAAKKLAKNPKEKSEAYRLSGECTVHRINGPIAGMRFGPTAKSDIEYALTLDKENWEAHRALGLMYLNNPPINGGDLDKAVETFTTCAEKDGDRDVYHALLAQAWMKKKRPERARLEVAKALQKNENNRLALDIKTRLEEAGKW
ncbi:hypothetical protein KQI84_04280 [bacterium]|nr:hypothetical protein [bacterium]